MTPREMFAEPETLPYVRDSSTSKAAAEAARPAAGRQRAEVYRFILGRGDEGATDEEIQTGTGINQNAERPRRVELVESKLVADSGRTRPTTSGRQATVWVAVTTNGNQTEIQQ